MFSILNNLFDFNLLNCSFGFVALSLLSLSSIYFHKLNGVSSDHYQNLSEKGVQTSNELLEKYIGDYLLDNMSTNDSTRLTQDFIDKYRDNP